MSTRAVVVAAVITGLLLGIVSSRAGAAAPPRVPASPVLTAR
ncbi:hypothetical protein [Streptomyces beihaiensis]|uniref:Uncharacterized protein n=1 Tax=Streptomyces beihaiensis TaxID=2984495 RepID=A0ABT3TUM1_9ACTN|nr:hypothetical protein [Streptomyces beihaiensis]MCX3060132.1 hypothetical protein [Streptomyces beihaiensis]